MGCKSSTLNNSEVLSRCRKRKRMMSDAVKYRQEFSIAHLRYIETLKTVGHALLQFADRPFSEREVMPGSLSQTEVEGADRLQTPLQNSTDPPTKPPTSPSKSPKIVTTSPPLASTSSEQQGLSHPKSDASNLSSTRSVPVTRENSEGVMSNGNSSPTFQSLVPELSGGGLMSPVPSSPISAASYYVASYPSSPQNLEWDLFNWFPASPFHSLEQTTRYFQRSLEQTARHFEDWDVDLEARDFVGADGIPDLEEDKTGENIELNEPRKVSAEQSNGKVNIMESLGKPEKKKIEANTDRVLEKIDENSAEEAEGSTLVDSKAESKENDAAAQEVKDHSGTMKVIGGVRQISDCVKRLNDAFTRASESGHEVSEMLETQFLYPRARILDFSDSFRFANTLSRQWSRKPVSRRMETNKSAEDLGQEDTSGSHSLTLERLYTWEKKLYKEVKVGEQLHVAFARKSKEFHSLDGKSKDFDLIEECRADVKSLESQLTVSFRAISSASIRIQQVTNGELYPQLVELLRRLKNMWKAMFECHTAQKAAALEIQSIKQSGHNFAGSDVHRSAAVKLENELEIWQQSFSRWVISQQNYIDTLLTWIKICYMEPEADVKSGAMSPAWTRGATPIYSLTRKWQDSLRCLEEDSVVNAICKFADEVHNIQLSESEELAQRKKAEMHSRSMDRRRHKGNVGRVRVVVELDKNVRDELLREDAVLPSLQQHLPHIFEALTTFFSVASKEYEKLQKEVDPLSTK